MKNYTHQKFTAGNYTEYFKSLILNFPGFQKFKKISGSYLDIGCGSGTQIFSVAPYFKNFSFTGIDISEPNIFACNEALSNRSNRLSFDFICDDFIEHEFNKKFILAFSYSVFQLMDTSIYDLLKRVWELLEPNGYLVLSMPYNCQYNKCLNVLRRILGRFRCNLFDSLSVEISHILYRKKFTKNFLRERMIYLDQIDYNLLDVKTIDAIDQLWKVEFQEKTPSPSFIQSRHMTFILRKIDQGAL
jgi:SAM-dependent methyltransferase